MKHILVTLSLTLFFMSSVWINSVYSAERTKSAIVKDIILKKRELTKSSSKWNDYVQALDAYFEKYQNNSSKINEISTKIWWVKNKLSWSLKEKQILMIIEYIELKIELQNTDTKISDPSSSKWSDIWDNSSKLISKADILRIKSEDILTVAVELPESEKKSLVYDMYSSEDEMYQEIYNWYSDIYDSTEDVKQSSTISKYYDYLIFYYYYANAPTSSYSYQGTSTNTNYGDINAEKLVSYTTSEIADFAYNAPEEEVESLLNQLYIDYEERYEAILLWYPSKYSSIEQIKQLSDISEHRLYLIYYKYYILQYNQDNKELSVNTSDETELTWSVIIDTNHQYAWKTLIYEVEILGIEKWDGTIKNTVQKNDIIEVHYIWKFENGEVFDNSYEHINPLKFTAWIWVMIPWFDNGVINMWLWEKRTLTINAKDAYWEYDPYNTQTIPKKDLKSFIDAWYKLTVWEELQTQFWKYTIIDIID